MALSGIGAIPTLGSVLKGVGKAVKSDKSRDDVFALVREYGKCDVDKFLTNLDWNVIKYEVLQIISEAILSFADVLDELAKKASFFGYDEYALEIGNFKSQVEAVEKQAHQHIPDALMFLKDKVDMSLRRGKSKSNAGSQSDKGSAEAGTHDDKVSQEKKEKKPDECWLCEKKVGKKKTEKPSATYCDQNGFKGKHHKKTDDEYGFAGRGTSGNGHYPWIKLKAHNNRKNGSSMQHPLYARCYDRDLNGKYVRPQQIWDNEEGLDAFQELKALGVTEKDKMEGLEKNLQAHHIITVNEMENNDFLFKKLPYLGYNLNDWHNIVVLPGIPELACFYEMPLHSGSHPTPYTDNVKRRLSLLKNAILGSKYCNENDSKALELIVKEMQQHSLDVYKQITQFRRMGALNYSNYDVYKKGNKGCCNKLKHSDIENDSTPCRHRTLSKMDASVHHDFRTTKRWHSGAYSLCWRGDFKIRVLRMDYYLLFSRFENGEGSFSVQEPWNLVLEYTLPQSKLLKTRGVYQVDQCYAERGMSDFLKAGIGKLASEKIQRVFYEHGFTGIQFVPVDVESSGLHHNYAFMNPTAHYDLLDPDASEARDLNDHYGGYSSVIEEVLDIDKFKSTNIEHDCFTLSTYKDPYYVSEKVKEALEEAGVTGIEFIPMEFA